MHPCMPAAAHAGSPACAAAQLPAAACAAAAVPAAPTPTAVDPGSGDPASSGALLRLAGSSHPSSGRHPSSSTAGSCPNPDAGPGDPALCITAHDASGSSGRLSMYPEANPGAGPADPAVRAAARGASRSSGRQRRRVGLPGQGIRSKAARVCEDPGPPRAASRGHAPAAPRGAPRAALQASHLSPKPGAGAGAANARPASQGARAAAKPCEKPWPCQCEGAAGAGPRRGGDPGSCRVQPGVAGAAHAPGTWAQHQLACSMTLKTRIDLLMAEPCPCWWQNIVHEQDKT